VELALAGSDEHGVSSMRLANGVLAADTVAEPFARTRVWALDGAEDGVRTVWAELSDPVGNATVVSARVVLDRAPPTIGDFVLADGASWARALGVPLRLRATDDNLRQVCLSNDAQVFDAADCIQADGAALDINVPEWALAEGADGRRTVYALARDAAGNELLAAASVDLDRSPSVPEALTLSPTVRRADILLAGQPGLSLQVQAADAAELLISDGGDGVHLVDDDNTFEWIPFQPAVPIALAGGDGPKRLEVSLRDAAGNEVLAALALDVVLDTTPPSDAALTIGGRDSVVQGEVVYVRSPQVDLALAASDENGVVSMRIANALPLGEVPSEPFVVQRSWALDTSQQGERSVYVALSDPVGNTTDVAARAILDTLPPQVAALVVQDGQLHARSLDVAVDVAASDTNLSTVCLSNDPLEYAEQDCLQAAAGAVSATVPAWELAPGPDGPRTVYAHALDAAGNRSVRSASILVDRLPPVGVRLAATPSTQVGDVRVTGQRSVTLQIDAQGASELRIDDGAGGGQLVDDERTYEWIDFQPNVAVSLAGDDGPKHLVVSLRDPAGHEVAAALQLTLELDTTPPTDAALTISGQHTQLAQERLWSRSTQVDLSLQASDTHGVLTMKVANALPLDEVAPEPFSAARVWALDGRSQGDKTVYAELFDPVGNSVVVSSSVWLDSEAPRIAELALDGCAGPGGGQCEGSGGAGDGGYDPYFTNDSFVAASPTLAGTWTTLELSRSSGLGADPPWQS